MTLKSYPNPKNLFISIKGLFIGLLSSSIMFTTLIVINLVQTLSLVIKPFSPQLFRSFNRWAANSWWGWCDLVAHHIYRVKFIFSGDDVPFRENAIVVLNHQEMTDVPVLFALARAKGRLGDLKWYVKETLKYCPGVGWGMLFLDCLFVKRNWAADENYIHHVFNNIKKHRIPFWVMSFVEGTRITPAKLRRSQEYAQKKGLKPLNHLLIPRTKGFAVTVKSLRDQVEAVYDVTIGYLYGAPTLWQWAQGLVHRCHIHVRRIEIKDMPQDDEALANWLIKLYQEKEQLLENFYQTGAFQSPQKAAA